MVAVGTADASVSNTSTRKPEEAATVVAAAGGAGEASSPSRSTEPALLGVDTET